MTLRKRLKHILREVKQFIQYLWRESERDSEWKETIKTIKKDKYY